MDHEVGSGPRTIDGAEILDLLRAWARELGFSQIGVADVDLHEAEPGLHAWLAAGFHGRMHYMARHGMRRARPSELVPGTVRVITARMDYLPRDADAAWSEREQARLRAPHEAVVSLYARGRDYHKVLRQRLQQLADRLAGAIGPFGHRVFTDSAPVLEVELAQRSGIGWRGKHTLVLSREAGSMFFLGEIYVDLALPLTDAASAHCGHCSACIDVCPTRAIVGPYRLDARRCISYLTIEHDGAIPVELRPQMGNRIYGCDDCQLVCPWNKYAQRASLPDFDTRDAWNAAQLLELWRWDEAQFLHHTQGTALRRIGHQRWRRNLAVALGNAWRDTGDPAVAQALQQARATADALVGEHIDWALAQRERGAPDSAQR
jgi:epoxyqueuosine reductase